MSFGEAAPGATCEVLRDILGRVNIDATQNFFARANGTNECSSRAKRTNNDDI
jgi:hypothetical protein